MATRYYYFSASSFALNNIRQRVPGGSSVNVVAPTFTETAFVVLSVNDALTSSADLIAAMAAEGFVYAADTTTAPSFSQGRDYGNQAADPTTPAIAESDRYWNNTSKNARVYTGAAWGSVPVNTGGATVADSLVAWSGTTGGYVQPTSSWTLTAGALSGTGGSLALPQGAAAAPTVSGSIAWNTTSKRLVVGDGAATKTFFPIDPTGLAQGDVIYYNGTDMVLLAPGTNGQVLTTGGPAANPSWTTNGTGDVTGPGSSTDNGIATFSGLTGKVIQSPSVWTLTAGALSGTGGSLALPQGAAAAPTVSGSIAWNTTSKRLVVGDGAATKTFFSIDPTGLAQGNVIYYNGTDMVLLAPGTNGQVLTTGGPAANPSWTTNGTGDVTGPGSSTDNGIATFSGLTGKVIQSPSVWTLTAGALSGTGGSLALPQGAAAAPTVSGSIAWNTTSKRLVVGDGAATKTFFSVDPTGLAQGNVIYYNGTDMVLLAPGSNGDYLTSGGPGANPSWSASAGGGLTQPQVMARIGFGGF